MGPENQFGDLGEELGQEGFEQLLNHAEHVCGYKCEEIRLANEPKIVALRAELARLGDEDKRLDERLRFAPPMGDRRSRHLKAILAGMVALALMVAGFFLSLLAFAPFRFGVNAYPFCVGIAVVCPYCVERWLEEWDSHRLIKAFVVIACVTAVTSLVLLAEIRGKLFAQELADAQSAVIIQDTSSDTRQNSIRFYQEADPLLVVMMAFLALAMELGAGLALHDAKRYGIDPGEDHGKVVRERTAVRHQIGLLAAELTGHENTPKLFETHFWFGFYCALLRHGSKRVLGKMLALFLCAALFGASTVRANTPWLNLVILVDLSASVATRGPDGKTDFQKNVEAVTELLGRIPPGTRLTIVGITGNSFQEPDILLSADVSANAGYFAERLASARQQLVREWQKRAVRLAPNAKRTDILGALLVTSQLFAVGPRSASKILVIYSDMRQATPELNLERARKTQIDLAIQQCRAKASFPNLRGVRLYALGVDGAGEDANTWIDLRRFWTSYFKAAAVDVKVYSVLRIPGGVLSQ